MSDTEAWLRKHGLKQYVVDAHRSEAVAERKRRLKENEAAADSALNIRRCAGHDGRFEMLYSESCRTGPQSAEVAEAALGWLVPGPKDSVVQTYAQHALQLDDSRPSRTVKQLRERMVVVERGLEPEPEQLRRGSMARRPILLANRPLDGEKPPTEKDFAEARAKQIGPPPPPLLLLPRQR